MRVGIDVRALQTASARRGVGTYIRGLLGGLALARRDEEILLFGAPGAVEVPPAFERVELSRPRRAITLWDQIAWPALLSRRGVTVFHSPFYAVPRLRPRSCAIVQTVHDLTPLRFPGAVTARQARVFRFSFKMARSAHRIIVPSAATRDDVVSLLGVPADRVAVIPLASGVGPDDVIAADGEAPGALRRAGLGERSSFLLHTGGHDPIKNIPCLLDAFAVLRKQGRQLDLVIAGEEGPFTPGILAHAERAGVLDRVKLPGFVSRTDLIALYRRAEALVYPSDAEGFGLPVLEAMACGTPVVASRAGALPEVAGSAGLLVPAGDAQGLAAAVASILDDPGRRDRMRSEGVARAARFSWRETARLTRDVYLEAHQEAAA
ncbi:MAG: glycosyltransferase family 4 protein [Candidatus Polarisedimenticolia bacterium]